MGRPRKNPLAGSSYVPKKVMSLPDVSDVITDNNSLWHAVLNKFQKTSRIFGFARIDVPLLEDGRLYEQFYKENPVAVKTVCGLSPYPTASVRPSLLPGILRAYYEHKLYEAAPFQKWSYSGFAAKSLDQGKRLVQDYEFGFELFGNFTHLAEAQTIAAVWEMLKSLGLEEIVLEINNFGEEDCQRVYQQSLGDFLSSRKLDLCDSCNLHLQSRPLNVLRCKVLDCQAVVSEAPTVLDFLSESANKHFTNILEALDELGIAYQLNPLYSGPEGHSRTNFAVRYKYKDESFLIGEGGYHDGLINQLCGKNYCSFGFNGSLSVIHEILELLKIEVQNETLSEVFLVPLGDLAAKKALKLFRDLTSNKVSVNDSFGHLGVKNQLKAAETQKVPIALIMGQKEAVEDRVILRDVRSGMQEIISYDKIIDEVKKRLGR